MIRLENSELSKLILHKVGNRYNEEKSLLNESLIELDDASYEILLPFFLKPFEKLTEYYQFNHYSDVSLNELYRYCAALFDNPDKNFIKESKNIASHLYEKSNYPQIKNGDLFVVLFEDIQFDDLITDALGIYKFENKLNFIKTYQKNGQNTFTIDNGISSQKLDKACLVLLSNDDTKFKILTIDSNNYDANYWTREFLNLIAVSDEYFHTKNYLSITNKFINEGIEKNFGLSSADKVDLLNKTVGYFKRNESFEENEFVRLVFVDEPIISSFNRFKEKYTTERNLQLANDFDISSDAVNKQSKQFKKVLKLDQNFHLYIHGDSSLIEKGFDNRRGKSYYKIFFDEEK